MSNMNTPERTQFPIVRCEHSFPTFPAPKKVPNESSGRFKDYLLHYREHPGKLGHMILYKIERVLKLQQDYAQRGTFFSCT